MLPETHVSFHTEDPALQRLYDAACEKALHNLQDFAGEPVLVEGGGYTKIWLETQPMGGEMYAKRNLRAALNNQLFFMRTQRADGRLAGSIQCHENGRIEPQFNKFQGFCFPWPALNMYYWIGEDREYLDRLADCLERFDDYLWRVRDSDGDGLLESWCVYDTGEDNAVRYGDAPVYCTEDTPPRGYQVVPMASMDFMAYSYAARDTLSEISAIRGDGRAWEWREKAGAVARTVREKLWDEARGACFDRDKNGNTMPILTHNNLRCMYWGVFSPDMARRFVKEHLTNPEEFWTNMPLPSVAANDPAFRNAPENNWSGQSEGLTWQRAILALERYNYEPLVTKLGRRFLRALIDGGCVFTQQFDPFTGAPSRVGMISHAPLAADSDEPFQDAYGPTLLAALEYIAHMWGVTMDRGRIWFSLARADAPYIYEQRWGEHTYRVVSDGKTASAFTDGIAVGRNVPCGVRLISDRAGFLVGMRSIE